MTVYETTFEATENLVQPIELGHGENADLHITVTDEGLPVSLSNCTISAIYQPESAWSTNTFYGCPAEISGNTGIVHWSHLQDGGDNAVKMWVRFENNGKVSYPAMYAMRLFKTPGFNPSKLTPIPDVIDFNEVICLNAPWLLSSDFYDWVDGSFGPAVNALSGDVQTLSNRVDGLSGEVGTLSGLFLTKNSVPYGAAQVRWDDDNFEVITPDYINFSTAAVTVFGGYFEVLDSVGSTSRFMVSGDNVIVPGWNHVKAGIGGSTLQSVFDGLSTDVSTLSATVGNINTILDSINGEVI